MMTENIVQEKVVHVGGRRKLILIFCNLPLYITTSSSFASVVLFHRFCFLWFLFFSWESCVDTISNLLK